MSRNSPKRRHGQFKGNARALSGHQPLTDVFSYTPPRIVHRGIRRAAKRNAPAPRPLSETHLAVLSVLSDEPQGQTAIARQIGVKYTSVTSALYVLAARDLARHAGMGKGWVRA